MSGRDRTRSILLLLVLGIGLRGEIAAQVRKDPAPPARTPASSPQKLGEASAQLHAIIISARLEDLRWPNFSDYRVHLDNFYR